MNDTNKQSWERGKGIVTNKPLPPSAAASFSSSSSFVDRASAKITRQFELKQEIAASDFGTRRQQSTSSPSIVHHQQQQQRQGVDQQQEQERSYFERKITEEKNFLVFVKPRYQSAGSRDSCGLFSLGRGWQELYGRPCGSREIGVGEEFFFEEEEEEEEERAVDEAETRKKKDSSNGTTTAQKVLKKKKRIRDWC